jgi:hypothetical protein
MVNRSARRRAASMETDMLPMHEAFNPVRAIQHGLEALKREPVGLLLGAFLMAILDGGGGGGGNNFSGSSDPSTWGNGSPGDLLQDPAMLTIMAIALGCVCILQIAFWLGKSFIQPGYIRLHEQLLVEGTSGPGKVFSGGDCFKAMAMWKLLKGVIVFGTMIVALAPGGTILAIGAHQDNTHLMVAGGAVMAILAAPVSIYVGFGLWLGEYAVALEGLGPMDALERSWGLASGNRLRFLLFSFVLGMFNVVGLMLCCVGVIGTKAIGDFGTTEAYLLATRDDWEQWRLTAELGVS